MFITRLIWVTLFILINLLIYTPGYIVTADENAFWPFFNHDVFEIRSLDLQIKEIVKMIFMRRYNLDPFRISVECSIAIGLIVLINRHKYRLLAVNLFTIFCLLLIIFNIYQASIYYFLHRPANLYYDIPLLPSLYVYVNGILGWKIFLMSTIFFILTLILIYIFRKSILYLVSSAVNSKYRNRLALTLIIYPLVSISWFGVGRVDANVNLVSTSVYKHVHLMREAISRYQYFSMDIPSTIYNPYANNKIKKRRNIHFILIESYGNILRTHEEMDSPYEDLMTQVELLLANNKISSMTNLSQSTTYGGSSWLAAASMQTGIKVENQRLYKMLNNHNQVYPHFTNFLNINGYDTISVEPGTTIKYLPKNNYNYSQIFARWDIPYSGTPYGFGGCPDQFTFNWVRSAVLPFTSDPYYIQIKTTTTHSPWQPLPQIVGDVPWHIEIAHLNGTVKNYFEAINYDWKVIVNYIQSISDDEGIFIVVGDHQPYIKGHNRVDVDVPIHVISRDTKFINGLKKFGFNEGMNLDSGYRKIHHEGFYSMMVKLMTESDHLPYLPNGYHISRK